MEIPIYIAEAINEIALDFLIALSDMTHDTRIDSETTRTINSTAYAHKNCFLILR